MVSRFFKRVFILPNLMRDAALEFKNDNFQKAIDIYQKVIHVFPKNYYAHLWAGTAYSAINQNKEAIYCYKNALEINRKGFDAYLNYARLEMKENRFQSSLNLINKAIQFSPFKAESHSNLYNQKGLLEYYLFNYADALDSFNKSLELVPENEDAVNGKTIAAEGLLATNNIEN
jgi:tetratricopeptide (TPR) repeat protein